MAHKRHLAFIINPKAGNIDHASSVLDKVESDLDLNKFTYSLEYTKNKGHARKLAANAVMDKVLAVIAVGGDGTINECASSLLGSEVVLGMIPVGSGNGLARDLGIFKHREQCLKIINNLQLKTIDCGVVNGTPFFCTAGVGFDAHVGKRFEDQKTRGFRGYIKTALMEYFSYEALDYLICLDNQEIEIKSFSLSFANACQFGNNAYIAPQSDPSDGFIDLCALEAFPKYRGLEMIYRLFTGTINRSQFMHVFRMKEAQVQCPPGTYYHIDGEVSSLEGNTLDIKVIPNAIEVLVPD